MGNTTVYNLNFKFINNTNHPLFTEINVLLPHPELKFGDNLALRAAFTDESASRYTVKLSWQDEQGNPFEELFYPTR